MLVVGEGRETEPNYFDGLKREDGVSRYWAVTVKRGRGQSPEAVIEQAVKLKQRAENRDEAFDQVWCVLDVEDSDKRDSLERAVKRAGSEGISICLSNPAFEVWFLAHYERTARSFPDADAVVRTLNKHWRKHHQQDYDKSDRGVDALIDVAKHHLHHVPWAGLVAEDLIFPIFVFMSGATMPFALTARLERGVRRRALYWRLFRRMVLLVALGLSAGFFKLDFPNMRPLSVLGLIGVAYFIAGVIVLNRGVRGQLAWAAGILLGYWAALYYIPVPGITLDRFSPGGSLGSYIDYHLLPGRLYGGVFDPEGILCFFPAAAMALLGAAAGRLLQTQTRSPYRNVLVLLLCGLASVALGFLWNPWFPIIKATWSSSFVLAAGGFGFLFLALFYLVIDVWHQRWVGFVFIPVGMNAVTIYVARWYVDFDHTSEKIFGGLTRLAGESLGPVVATFGVLAVEWAVLYFLYRKKIFLRV